MSFKFSHREINDVTGNVENWYYDEDTNRFTIKTTHDIGAVLKANKERSNSSHGQRYGEEMLHSVAEIPNGVIIKLKREHGVDIFSSEPEQQRKLRRLLDDPAYSYLKTTTKKLSRTTRTR